MISQLCKNLRMIIAIFVMLFTGLSTEAHAGSFHCPRNTVQKEKRAKDSVFGDVTQVSCSHKKTGFMAVDALLPLSGASKKGPLVKRSYLYDLQGRVSSVILEADGKVRKLTKTYDSADKVVKAEFELDKNTLSVTYNYAQNGALKKEIQFLVDGQPAGQQRIRTLAQEADQMLKLVRGTEAGQGLPAIDPSMTGNTVSSN